MCSTVLYTIITSASAKKLDMCSLNLIMVSLDQCNIILSWYDIALPNFYSIKADEQLLQLLCAYYNGCSLLCIQIVLL